MVLNFEKVRFKIVKELRPECEKIGEVGDYFKNWIIVRDLGVDFYNELILIHELVEYFLIIKFGLEWEEIDRFKDKEYRKKHLEKYKLYRKAHNLALQLEKKIIKLLNRNWEEYFNHIKNYGKRKK